MNKLFGAIEAGGTKFICAIGDKELNIIDRVSIKTTTPEETMKQVFKFFDKYNLVSMGIGSFGPIDMNKNSSKYGYITNTPKSGWNNYNFVGEIKSKYDIPLKWTTDVNAAAYGEAYRGNARGKSSCIYITVGTGIGGGVVVNGTIFEGNGHPEMGHILVRKSESDKFEGGCPYHSNCLEGMASGLAIEKRWGKKAYKLEDNEEVWKMEAFYIAQGIMTFSLVFNPECIILGGGVMKQEQLFPLVRKELEKLMNGYLTLPKLDEYILPPGLGDDAGITGCLLLAKDIVNIDFNVLC